MSDTASGDTAAGHPVNGDADRAVAPPPGRPRKIVIVGGVAAGMSAATRLRRNDETLEIVVLEKGEHVSFANCGLPYHVGHVIEDRASLLLQTPESLAARFALDVRVGHEVIGIDRRRRAVTVRRTADGAVLTEPYDALVLATGASPIRPPLPGADRAFTLRDIDDLDRIMVALAEGELDGEPRDAVRTAAILGGGFIGLELAENLTRRGVSVTLIEAADQILAPLDPEMVRPVTEQLERSGVRVRTGTAGSEITPDAVLLDDGRRVPADLVVLAVGVRPESALARQASLEVDPRGGVVVDESQRTSDPRIFAVGDVAVKRDAIDGSATLVPLAQTANRHGRLVADVITGRRVTAPAVLGTAIVEVFGLAAAAVGWNEKRLRAAGRTVENGEIRVIHTHPLHHAGYYPGAAGMSLKLLVDARTDAVLGAQAVGAEGVDKRIDVIATAIRGGISAVDLADLELAYAPQFGSAKDPVNLLGMIADNLASGAERTLQWHQLERALEDGATLVDVRSPAEFAAGAIPKAINVPLDELRGRLAELPAGPLVVTCAVGQRGHTAARLLTQLGRDAANLDGGYRTWSAATR